MVKKLFFFISFFSCLVAYSSAFAGFLPEVKGKTAYLKGVNSFKTLPKLEIVEYFNFACGHCYDYAKKGEEALLKKYGDRIVYKAYPIYWGKQNHYPSLLYLMSGGTSEDKFKFRKMIFDAFFIDKVNIFDKRVLGMMTPDFSLASEFSRKADTPEGKKIMQKVLTQAEKFNVHGTPTFIINESIVVTPTMTGKSIEEFINNLNVVIDSVLEKYYVK